MNKYERKFNLFSLCGLICGLCPRYHTDGTSKCPGCGGTDFYLKHPACAVITCNKKHDNVEYCFQCSQYPCKKYSEQIQKDSFITYKKVITDFKKANKSGIKSFEEEVNRKVQILENLIKNYNDDKRKNFYCISVNLISLDNLENIMKIIDSEINILNVDKSDKIKLVVELFESVAKKKNIELKLRK